MRFDNELERAVHDWLEATVAQPSRSVMVSALERVEQTPQRRHRWLGWWFGRGGGAARRAGEHGAPDDENPWRNRHMVSLSLVTASTAALVVAATLAIPRPAAETGVAPGAAAGTTYVVAADASGDFTTISAAVAAAAAGDTVLVRPGEYAEALVVDKDITLRGDGPREDIVITFLEGAPPTDMGIDVYIPVVLRDFDGTLAGVTVRAPAEGGAVLVEGGAPLLQDLSMTVDPEAYGTLAMGGQSRPVVRDSVFERGVVTDEDGTSPVLEGNTFTGDAVSLGGPGTVSVLGNTFRDGGALSATAGLTGLVEGNTFVGNQTGVPSTYGLGISSQSDLVVRDNTFADWDIGLSVGGNATATIEDNEFTDSRMAIAWSSTRDGAIDGNTIHGGFAGITLSGGTLAVTGNTIEDVTGRGLAIGRLAHAVVADNTICGCGTNLSVDERSDAEVGDNDICADEGPA